MDRFLLTSFCVNTMLYRQQEKEGFTGCFGNIEEGSVFIHEYMGK